MGLMTQRSEKKKEIVDLVNLKRAHWKPTKYSAVCSKHSLDEDYSVMFSGLTTVDCQRRLWEDDIGAIGPGGGGYSKKFYTGRLRPEIQPLTLLYTIFPEKVPLLYTFYWKKAPLLYTLLRRLVNKSLKQEVLLSLFSRSVY